MIWKNTRDIKLPNFLYVFHQVFRYLKLCLENFVPRDQGRWHKILGWEVTFCEKVVTINQSNWDGACDQVNTYIIMFLDPTGLILSVPAMLR